MIWLIVIPIALFVALTLPRVLDFIEGPDKLTDHFEDTPLCWRYPRDEGIVISYRPRNDS